MEKKKEKERKDKIKRPKFKNKIIFFCIFFIELGLLFNLLRIIEI